MKTIENSPEITAGIKLNDHELEQLNTLLPSTPIEDEGMLLSGFDGFCDGLVVCPEIIMPNE